MNRKHLWVVELQAENGGWWLGKKTFPTREHARQFVKNSPFTPDNWYKFRVSKFIRADLVKEFCDEQGLPFDEIKTITTNLW